MTSITASPVAAKKCIAVVTSDCIHSCSMLFVLLCMHIRTSTGTDKTGMDDIHNELLPFLSALKQSLQDPSSCVA